MTTPYEILTKPLFSSVNNAKLRFMLYILLFILGFIFVSGLSFYLVIRPPKITLNRTSADFGLPTQDITLTTEDGLKLSTWFIDQGLTLEIPRLSLEKRAIILIHGYPAEKSDMLSVAKALWPDFSLLIYDQRYFGKSEGRYTTLGIKERLDLKSALDFLESRGYQKIGVFGFSLGGAVGIITAAEDKRINAVASYGAFSNLKILGEETYSHLWPLKKPLVRLMLFWSRLLFKESLVKISPENAAVQLNIPIFIIHSKQDEQISFRHAERLKNALAQNPKAEFYFIEHGLHGELSVDFDSRLKKFFDSTFK